MGRSAWWRAARAALALALIALAARQLLRGWREASAAPIDWQLRPVPLVASALVVWAMYALLIVTWRRLVATWDRTLPLGTAARIWLVSSLGKYVPGKVWAIAGMALMAQRAGVAPWAATAAAVLNQVLAVGAGVVAVSLTARPLVERAWPGAGPALWALLAASVAGLAVVASPAAQRRLFALARLDRAPAPAAGGALALGAAANLAAWTGYGVALWLLARGTLAHADLPLGVAIGTFAASYLAGFLALLAPAGLGVRESVFILMLEGTLGAPRAAALAVASRLLLTVTEVGAAVPFLPSREPSRVAP